MDLIVHQRPVSILQISSKSGFFRVFRFKHVTREVRPACDWSILVLWRNATIMNWLVAVIRLWLYESRRHGVPLMRYMTASVARTCPRQRHHCRFSLVKWVSVRFRLHWYIQFFNEFWPLYGLACDILSPSITLREIERGSWSNRVEAYVLYQIFDRKPDDWCPYGLFFLLKNIRMNCLDLSILLWSLRSWTFCFLLFFFQMWWLLLIVYHSDGTVIVVAICIVESTSISSGCTARWVLSLFEWIKQVFDYHCRLFASTLLEGKLLHLNRLVYQRFFVNLCRRWRIVFFLGALLQGGWCLSRRWQVALDTFLTSAEIYLVSFRTLIRLLFRAISCCRWLWLTTCDAFEWFLSGLNICWHWPFQPTKTWVHIAALVIRASIRLLLLRCLDVLRRVYRPASDRICGDCTGHWIHSMHLLVSIYMVQFNLWVAGLLHLGIIDPATDHLLKCSRVVIGRGSINLVLCERLFLMSVLVWSVNIPNFLFLVF